MYDEEDDFVTKQDLRDTIEELSERVQTLIRKNEQMTMDLILIAANLGVEPGMVPVLGRISELLDREQAYKSLMNIG